MNTDAVRAGLVRIDSACDRILEWVFARGALTLFPRTVWYMSKENGGTGWEDSYQNRLISRLCSSRWFESCGESTDLFRCIADSTVWRRDRFEWRMMALKDTLVCLTPADPLSRPDPVGARQQGNPVFFSRDFARTVGFDPVDAQPIDLRFFVRFLTELEDGTCLEG